MDLEQLSGATLAYLGDAVFELYVRRRLIGQGLTRSKDLSAAARSYVNARAQSEAVERLLPLLNPEESEIYKRGRNGHGVSAPKSADTVSYRRATGVEALFGWLYLTGREARAQELFDRIFEEGPAEKTAQDA